MAAISILLAAAGAVLTFAVTAEADGIDLSTVGIILMVVGGIGLVFSLLRGVPNGWRSERHVSDDGKHVVEESHTTL